MLLDGACCMMVRRMLQGALRSLPGFLTMVDYEPVLWPLSARHVGMPGWKELLSRIRVMLQRMYGEFGFSAGSLCTVARPSILQVTEPATG